jgi:microsomal dipeptidase-like Zn-dependent dipeptidase
LSLLPPAAPAAGAGDEALARVRRVLAAHPVLDGHNDLPWAIRENPDAPGDVAAYDLRFRTRGDTDLERLREGGVGGQFWSVYIPADLPGGFARMQLEQIDFARRMIARYPDRLALAGTADEVERRLRDRRRPPRGPHPLRRGGGPGDEVLEKVKANGGIVMVTFVNAFVSPEWARVHSSSVALPSCEEYAISSS